MTNEVGADRDMVCGFDESVGLDFSGRWDQMVQNHQRWQMFLDAWEQERSPHA